MNEFKVAGEVFEAAGLIEALERIDAQLEEDLREARAALARAEQGRRLSVLQLGLAVLGVVAGVLTLVWLPREPAGAEVREPIATVVTATTVPSVGLIPPACASIDPVAFPCGGA